MGFGEGREKLFFRKVFSPFPNLPLLLPHQPRDLLPQDAGGGFGGDAVKLAKTGSNVTPAIVATVVMVSSAIFGGSYARRSRRKA